jgi:hydrogenase maturation protein HypF
VPVAAKVPVLAVGAELKSTICVLAGQTAIVSEHLGELANAKAYRNFVATVEQFQKLLRVRPQVIAYDLHPEYTSTRFAQQYALEHGLPAIGVQHHHAHVVSAMAENGLTGRVLGISCDGTGFGTDGAIWGCELLVADERDFTRAGHLRYFPLLGGDAAARETWRPAAALLHDAFGDDWTHAAGAVFERVSHEAIDLARTRLAHPARLALASSLGRLFDAVAFLLGLADDNHHEAQAAMALESAARRAKAGLTLTFNIETRQDGHDGPLELDVRPMIRELVAARQAGQDVAVLARAFHETMAAGLTQAAITIARNYGLNRVVLSGGCFANRVLLASLSDRLTRADLEVWTHRLVPTGDGGVSLGQAVSAARRIEE